MQQIKVKKQQLNPNRQTGGYIHCMVETETNADKVTAILELLADNIDSRIEVIQSNHGVKMVYWIEKT